MTNQAVNFSQELVGKRLRKLCFEDGEVVLEFDDESTLAIQNLCEFIWRTQPIQGDQLAQMKITKVTQGEELQIAFGEQLLLRVDLSPAAHRGPEALVLSRGQWIVAF